MTLYRNIKLLLLLIEDKKNKQSQWKGVLQWLCFDYNISDALCLSPLFAHLCIPFGGIVDKSSQLYQHIWQCASVHKTPHITESSRQWWCHLAKIKGLEKLTSQRK